MGTGVINSELEAEYASRLKKFEKYQFNGIDLAYKCYQCNKNVFQRNIVYGIACTRCGSGKVYPITQNLTKFGLLWFRFWNWYYARKNSKKFGKI